MNDNTLEQYAGRVIQPCLEMCEKALRVHNISENELATKLNQEEEFLKKENVFCIPRLVLIVTTKCTLNCKHCINIIPYIKHPTDISMSQVINDCKRILAAVDKCYTVSLVGGEGLMNPELDKILSYLIHEPKVHLIEIMTNAVMLPREEWVPLLQNSKVVIEISDYGYLNHMAKSFEFLEHNQINFNCNYDLLWTCPGGVESRHKGLQQLKNEYKRCSSGRLCKTILNGKFYQCARAALLDNEGYFQAQSFDYVPLCTEKELRQQIRAFYLNEYTTACDYCDFMDEKAEKVIPAEQTINSFIRSKYTIISRKDYKELHEWVQKQQEAKEWLKQQYKNYKSESEQKDNVIEELHQWTEDQEKAKVWLEKQYNSYKAESEQKDKIIESLKSEKKGKHDV